MSGEEKLEKRLDGLGLAMGRGESMVGEVMGRIERLGAGTASGQRVDSRTKIWRTIMNRGFVKYAAAAVVVIGVVGVLAWLTGGNGGARVAFADVVEQIGSFRPYACSVTVQDKGGESIEKRAMHWSLTKRREIRSDGTILVFDLGVPKMLTLVPDKKYAIEKMLNRPPTTNHDLLEIVRDMQSTLEEASEIEEVGNKNFEEFQHLYMDDIHWNF